jgi:ubiquitin fusion degradation protein 1
VTGCPLDFRSPSNYIFLPHWMFLSLNIAPGSVVSVGLYRNPLSSGGTISLTPLCIPFSSTNGGVSDARIIPKQTEASALLETHLKHYSTLTVNTIIPINYNNKVYYFRVRQLKDERDVGVRRIKCVDCDVRVVFDQGKVI